jgi:hypothetical protein
MSVRNNRLRVNAAKDPAKDVQSVSSNTIDFETPVVEPLINKSSTEFTTPDISQNDCETDNILVQETSLQKPVAPAQEISVAVTEKIAGQRKAVLLLKDLNKVMRMQKARLNMNIDEYFAHIITKEIAEANLGLGAHGEELYDRCYRMFLGQKERTTIVLSPEHLTFVESEIKGAGITFADYANYVIKKWKDR